MNTTTPDELEQLKISGCSILVDYISMSGSTSGMSESIIATIESGYTDVNFLTLDVDEYKSYSFNVGIFAVPFVEIYRGHSLVDWSVGVHNAEYYESILTGMTPTPTPTPTVTPTNTPTPTVTPTNTPTPTVTPTITPSIGTGATIMITGCCSEAETLINVSLVKFAEMSVGKSFSVDGICFSYVSNISYNPGYPYYDIGTIYDNCEDCVSANPCP